MSVAINCDERWSEPATISAAGIIEIFTADLLIICQNLRAIAIKAEGKPEYEPRIKAKIKNFGRLLENLTYRDLLPPIRVNDELVTELFEEDRIPYRHWQALAKIYAKARICL